MLVRSCALDRSHVLFIILCNNTSTAYDYYTNIYRLLKIHISTSTSTSVYAYAEGRFQQSQPFGG